MAPLKIISLGLGQQSTVLYFLSSMGKIPRADYAIFSDTGSESAETYRYLNWLKEWQADHKGIPIIHAGRKSIYGDLLYGEGNQGAKYAVIPLFTKSKNGKKGLLKRQCTQDYKIKPINKVIRELHGITPRKRTPATTILLGITIEEIERIKQPRLGWQSYSYPFCGIATTKEDFQRFRSSYFFRRSDCVAWLKAEGLPVPPKSACFFCPFQSNERWLEMKRQRPDEWQKAVHLDQNIRHSSQRGIRQAVYLHRTCMPLEEVNLQENQTDLFKGECAGMCGV